MHSGRASKASQAGLYTLLVGACLKGRNMQVASYRTKLAHGH